MWEMDDSSHITITSTVKCKYMQYVSRATRQHTDLTVVTGESLPIGDSLDSTRPKESGGKEPVRFSVIVAY